MSVKPKIPIEPGRLVVSKAGRDRGRAMAVLSLTDDGHAMTADGRLRRAAKPKKKKFRHLAAKPECIEGIEEKLRKNAALLDAEIRAALAMAGYNRTEPNEEGCGLGEE